MQMAAGKFKAKCLKLMDEVKDNNIEIIITKYGKPVAKLVPFEKTPTRPIFGYLENELIINDDIIKTTGEEWNAEK